MKIVRSTFSLFKSPNVQKICKRWNNCKYVEGKYKIGRSAVVTGSSMGIGLEMVKALLSIGVMNIILSSSKSVKQGEDEMYKLRRRFGNSCLSFHKCDVTKCNEMRRMFISAIKVFGGIDIVINNAGIVDETLWDLMVDVNLKGVIVGSQLGMYYMAKDRGGHGGTIVNISSIMGLGPSAGSPVYSATKHAVVGYSRSLSMPFHYDSTKVRVMVMCPGVTLTKLVDKTRKDSSMLGKQTAKEWSDLPQQHVCHTGQCLKKMLTVGDPGSVWTVEDQEIYEIKIPDRQKFTRRS